MGEAPVAENRQAQITRVAAELFNERGFHQTSMEDIAAAVGIKKPTLYHYVKSKSQIVMWIHDECVGAVAPPLVRYMKSDLSAAEILRNVAVDIFGLLEDRPGYLRVYFEHHRDLDARAKSRSTKKRDAYYDNVRQVLERGNASGELKVSNPTLAAMAFFGMCNWGYQWYRPGGSRSAREIGEYVCSLFIAGVMAPGTDRLDPRVEAATTA